MTQHFDKRRKSGNLDIPGARSNSKYRTGQSRNNGIPKKLMEIHNTEGKTDGKNHNSDDMIEMETEGKSS